MGGVTLENNTWSSHGLIVIVHNEYNCYASANPAKLHALLTPPKLSNFVLNREY